MYNGEDRQRSEANDKTPRQEMEKCSTCKSGNTSKLTSKFLAQRICEGFFQELQCSALIIKQLVLSLKLCNFSSSLNKKTVIVMLTSTSFQIKVVHC